MFRIIAGLCRALIALVLWAAVPVLLVAVGWVPWPRHRPSLSEVQDWLDDPLRPDRFPAVGWGAMWLLWIGVTCCVIAMHADRLRRRNWRRRWQRICSYLPGPVQGLAATLLGTATVAASTAMPAHSAPPKPVTAGDNSTAGRHTTLVAAPPDSRPANDVRRSIHVVKRGDTLFDISRKRLGDADRWREICQLNKNRHFAKVGGTLRDCDLIFPGWDLRLPGSAKAPSTAASATPETGADQPPSSSATPTPSAGASAATSITPPTIAGSSSPALPATSGSAVPSTSAVAPSPGRTLTPSVPTATASLPRSSETAAPATTPISSEAAPPAATSDEHGVQLSPWSWVSWMMAATISAAATLVWRQRRRGFTGEADEAPLMELPPPVDVLRREVDRHPERTQPVTGDSDPPGVADLAPLLPGGTGLVGSGAPAAARAALVGVLASGDPHHPDIRAEVIVDVGTLVNLLGPDGVTLGPWPRLHVTDTIDDALTAAETRLLHRSRILDEHTVSDLDELRRTAPDEEALPPIILITATPPTGARMRAKVALALGEGLQLSALLLGEWAHGVTIEITEDGHTTLVSGQATAPIPARMPVLEPAPAIQILTTLREAQTGDPPAIASPTIPVTVVPLHTTRTQPADTESAAAQPADPVAPSATGRARLRVLGPPRIEGITAEGRPLRAKALELAVYLAVHPDGAATREIGEYLEPDARISQADQRVHTNASNLRHVLGRAGTAETKNAYVIKAAGRYRLDSATVDVDVWNLRDLMRKAAIATEPRRRELLTAACDLSSAPLAEGQDYEWIQPHRETVRRWGTEAHLLLADDLLDSDPQAASDLLDKAIGLDRYNEALYAKAMHARHALGDADGIRTLLRALTKALADLDAEPREDTIELAQKLRTSLDGK
jgi:DNA-binding SARP family transcriptional activator